MSNLLLAGRVLTSTETILLLIGLFVILPTIIILLRIFIKKAIQRYENKKANFDERDHVHYPFAEKLKQEKQDAIKRGLQNQNSKQDIKIYSNYKKKKHLMSYAERNVFKNIQIAIENSKLIVYPQINLATIIEKIDGSKYRSELFRNLDYCLFEKTTLEPICAIELNDKTHAQRNRAIRDKKVRSILASADIPLITLYTDFPNTAEYIKKRIYEATTNLKTIN